MNVDAGTEGILKLLLGEGKEFARMDAILSARFQRVLELLLEAEKIAHVARSKSLNLKSFDGHFQVCVDAEKRLWFEEHYGELVIVYFGSTDHKHGRMR